MDTENTNPSEKRYGITKQPPPTCDIINTAISEVEDCLRELRGYEKAEEEELRNMLSRIESNLGSLVGYRKEGHLEDIRRNGARLKDSREWCSFYSAVRRLDSENRRSEQPHPK